MSRPSPSAAADGVGRWLETARGRRIAFGALLAAALIGALLVPTYPNYDSYFHLAWGREVLDGHLPHVEAYAAPTQHPGLLLVCIVFDGLFGPWADRALVLLCVASLAALIAGSFRVGRACFGLWPGVLGALFTGSSFAFLLYAARGYVDVPFLALVLWAAALEAERAAGLGPDRSRRAGVVLAVAGLLRPEAWILAGLLWLWRGGVTSRGRRLVLSRFDLLALTLVAPLAWASWDLILTGDPLYSLNATSALADELGRERGLSNVPRSFVSFLADTARPPVFAAAVLGAGLAGWQRERLTALHVPLALFAAGALTFIGTGAGGLSILPRYLTVPAVALCIVGGYAVAGFTRLEAGRLRELWTRGAAAAAVVGVLFLLLKAGSFVALGRELRFIDRTHHVVAALAEDRRLTCPTLSMPTYRLIPDLRFELDAPESAVLARTRVGGRPRGTRLYVVGDDKAIRRFGKAAGVSSQFNRPPTGYREAFRDGFLSVEAACRR